MSENLSHNPTESKERIVSSNEMTGFHGRVLLSDQKFLNPREELKSETDLQFKDFQDRDYTIFEDTSKNDRGTYWADQVNKGKVENNFDSQRDIWTDTMVKGFSSENSKQYTAKLSGFFGAIGVNLKSFDKAQAEGKIYDRYFSKNNVDQNGNSGVKRFVSELTVAYNNDLKKILQDKEAIEWFSTIFGEPSKEIITNLIEAEVRLKKDKDGLITALKKTSNGKQRINDLNTTNEVPLLEHLTNQEATTVKRQPETQPQETTRPPDGKLPIWEKQKEILEAIKNRRTIIIGETGSGKTTQVPQIIIGDMKAGDKIIITQPTQLNTEKIAKDIADQMGKTIGEEISWQHGGGREVVADKDKEILAVKTEGIVVLQLMQLLEDQKKSDFEDGRTYYLMVDEAHIQSQQTELLLYLVKEAQQKYPEIDLRLIVSSATIDKKTFMDYLEIDESQVVESKGRTYDINKTDFVSQTIADKDLPIKAAQKIAQIHKRGNYGHIFEFFPGSKAIRDAEKEIQRMKSRKEIPDLPVLKLYRGAPPEEIELAKSLKNTDTPHILLCTDFAMTGITVEGATDVVVTGKRIQQKFDTATGIEITSPIDVSKSEIEQMIGRAGRTNPGFGHYMFTKKEYDRRPEYPEKELERSDLTELVLRLKQIGVKDIRSVNLLTKLDPQRIDEALETLERLGALVGDQLTREGKRMSELPTDFHFARAIAEADRYHCVEEVTAIAALAEKEYYINNAHDKNQPNILSARHDFYVEGSDFLTILNIYNSYRDVIRRKDPSGRDRTNDEIKASLKEWSDKYGISLIAMNEAYGRHGKREKLLGKQRNRGVPTTLDIEKCFAVGFQDKLLKRNADNISYTMIHNKRVHPRLNTLEIDEYSSVSPTKNPDIVTGDIYFRSSGSRSYARLCQRVLPGWNTGV